MLAMDWLIELECEVTTLYLPNHATCTVYCSEHTKKKSPHSGVEITSGFTHSLRGCY